MLGILKLDSGGFARGWVNHKEATKQYADSSVLWGLGNPIFKKREGISRATIKQFTIESHSIIMVKVAWMNLVISYRPCSQLKNNHTPEQAGMGLLYASLLPSLYECMTLIVRYFLDNQMDFLTAMLSKTSRLLEGLS